MLPENWDYSNRWFSKCFVKINCIHIKTREVHIHFHASWGSVQRPLQSLVSTKSRSCYLWTCISCRPQCQEFWLVSSVTLFWVSICHLTGWLLKNIVFWKLFHRSFLDVPSPSPSLSLSVRQIWIQHDHVLAQCAAVAESDNSTKVDWP